jgi:hypothetical protein
MSPDETPPPTQPDEDDAVFEFGDRTLFALRAQPFTIEHEYGTMMLPAKPMREQTAEIPMPPVATVESALDNAPAPEPAAAAAPAEAATDPLARLELKVDAALRLMQSLQQQLDSIDATLARALNR